MHELSIAMSILDTAAEEAERLGDVQVCAIHIRVGLLSGVVKSALVSAFELAREGSPFTATRLIAEEEPVVIFCEVCQSDRSVESIQSMCCICCGTPSSALKRGRELEITGMEILE